MPCHSSKQWSLSPHSHFFASFPCILLADNAFALSAQVAMVVIHSIGSHIYAHTTACWKYSAAGSATLRSRLHELFQIRLNNLSPKRQQVKCRIFRLLVVSIQEPAVLHYRVWYPGKQCPPPFLASHKDAIVANVLITSIYSTDVLVIKIDRYSWSTLTLFRCSL